MGSKSKTKTSVAPPSWAQGTIQNALSGEQGAFNTANQTFQQFNPAETNAVNTIANTINNPAHFITDARTNLDNTINGQYLTPNSNPYEAAMGKQIADQTAGEYNASYGAAGRAHGGMAALLSSQGIGNALNNLYGNIYENERSRQQQATMAEPAFNADQYTGENELFPAVNATAMGPLQAAAMFGSSVGNTVGPYGTTTTTQSQPFGLQQALGLGMMAAGAFIPGAQPLMGLGMGMGGLGSYGAGLGMGMGRLGSYGAGLGMGMGGLGSYGAGLGMGMGGLGSYGAAPGGMAGLLAPTGGGGINIGGGTNAYFNANPFGGSFGG